MITLRHLKLEDRPFMKEWMLDPDVTQFFRFSTYDEDRVTQFILESQQNEQSRHYAIVDENDEYLGTISLKHIDFINLHAEYAIVLRKKVWGKGIGSLATSLILEQAQLLKLHKVYLNVLSSNTVAIRLYRRVGFVESGIYKDHLYRDHEFHDLLYFEKILGENDEL